MWGECAGAGQAMLMMLIKEYSSVVDDGDGVGDDEDDDDGGDDEDDDAGVDDDEDDDDCGTAGVQECITRERMERRPRHQRADGASILSRTGSSPKAHFFNWGINPPKSNSDATEEGAWCPFAGTK